MKFHVIEKSGHRREVSPLEYASAPICKRDKLMEAIRLWQDKREARTEIQATARAALRLAEVGE